MIFKLGELFCGPGGLALGASLAEPQYSKSGEKFFINHIWGVDKDNDAIATYKKNISNNGISMDAIEFSLGVINEQPSINALAFGFPCNDFSLVGKKRGMGGAFGQLYIAGVNAINNQNPQWFIAENVSGISAANKGTEFQHILNALRSAGKGYSLTVHLYKFEDYGVAQTRHRYIIVGIRNDVVKKNKVSFCIPAPTHGPGRENKYLSVKEELEKPYLFPAQNNEHGKLDENVILRLKFTPPGKNAWYLDTLLNFLPGMCRQTLQEELPWFSKEFQNMSEGEIREAIKKCKLNCTKARMSHIYKRLLPNEPAYTVTGSGGGGTHIYHWREHRQLTNRERARIQSFPDDFEFCGGLTNVQKQIGMAVPPRASKQIFEAILKSFAHIPYDSIEANYLQD